METSLPQTLQVSYSNGCRRAAARRPAAAVLGKAQQRLGTGISGGAFAQLIRMAPSAYPACINSVAYADRLPFSGAWRFGPQTCPGPQ